MQCITDADSSQQMASASFMIGIAAAASNEAATAPLHPPNGRIGMGSHVQSKCTITELYRGSQDVATSSVLLVPMLHLIYACDQKLEA